MSQREISARRHTVVGRADHPRRLLVLAQDERLAGVDAPHASDSGGERPADPPQLRDVVAQDDDPAVRVSHCQIADDLLRGDPLGQADQSAIVAADEPCHLRELQQLHIGRLRELPYSSCDLYMKSRTPHPRLVDQDREQSRVRMTERGAPIQLPHQGLPLSPHIVPMRATDSRHQIRRRQIAQPTEIVLVNRYVLAVLM
jgi:hypothetical protein